VAERADARRRHSLRDSLPGASGRWGCVVSGGARGTTRRRPRAGTTRTVPALVASGTSHPRPELL